MSNLTQPIRILALAALFLALAGMAVSQPAVAESSDDLALDQLEKAVAQKPNRLAPGNAYRMRCIALEEFDRPIEFLEKQVEEHPDSLPLRLNLAFAYVDKMPTRGTIGQGLLSRKSIAQFEKVLEADPDNWLALFGKAMNNLHWPRIFNRLPDAVEGFRRCLELQKKASSQGPHFALTYLVLGDALTLEGDVAQARQIWREGARLFPDVSELKDRLQQDDSQIVGHVEEKRNLALRINTDLTGIEEEAP